MRLLIIFVTVVIASCTADSPNLSPTGLGALAASATEAKGGKPEGALSQPIMLSDANGDGPSRGDRITFNVITTAIKPFVGVNCYQGKNQGQRNWVYAAEVGYFELYPGPREFYLAADSWTSGAADCEARLYESNLDGTHTQTLATVDFHATAG